MPVEDAVPVGRSIVPPKTGVLVAFPKRSWPLERTDNIFDVVAIVRSPFVAAVEVPMVWVAELIFPVPVALVNEMLGSVETPETFK